MAILRKNPKIPDYQPESGLRPGEKLLTTRKGQSKQRAIDVQNQHSRIMCDPENPYGEPFFEYELRGNTTYVRIDHGDWQPDPYELENQISPWNMPGLMRSYQWKLTEGAARRKKWEADHYRAMIDTQGCLAQMYILYDQAGKVDLADLPRLEFKRRLLGDLLRKVLPDLKAIQIQSNDRPPIEIRVISDQPALKSNPSPKIRP